MSYNKGSSSTTSTSSGNSWLLDDALKGMWGDVMGEIQQGGAPTQSFTQGQLDAMQAAGLGGTAGQYYSNIMSGQGQADRYAGLQQMQQASAAQSANALEGALAAQGLQSAASGSAGGSRQGVAAGVATAQASTDLAAIQAAQNQQFMQNELSLQNNAAQALQNIAGTQFGYESLKQQQDFQNQFGQTSAGKMAYLMNFLPGLSGLGGTATSSGSGKQSGFGVDLGSGMQGAGQLLGGLSLFSDVNLKKNIKKIGKHTEKGVPMYEWEWNEEGNKLGLFGKGEGVLAQEAAILVKDAVVKDSSGYLKVDYSKV